MRSTAPKIRALRDALKMSADSRQIVRVACGVVLGEGGKLLAAQRPIGKLAAGKWEFPGGKIEPGETAEAALIRELHEELGITVRRSWRLLRFQHDYSDRCVILDVRIVDAFDGTPESREQQALRWVSPVELMQLDVLPTVAPIVRALQLPSNYVFTPQMIALPRLIASLSALPRGAWLRLRLPALDDSAYASTAREVLAASRELELSVMLDRAPELVEQLDAAGWHATQSQLDKLSGRPVSSNRWFAASAHDRRSLLHAQALNADWVVLGPVVETPTHPGAPVLQWSGFSELVAISDLPIHAIGGVGPDQIDVARIAGAMGVAGISAYWHRDTT